MVKGEDSATRLCSTESHRGPSMRGASLLMERGGAREATSPFASLWEDTTPEKTLVYMVFRRGKSKEKVVLRDLENQRQAVFRDPSASLLAEVGPPRYSAPQIPPHRS